ncbi:low molecular weight protein-tyrosine-phosphatase [Paenibacillus endoradicis]|uniref:low molecular weight protein-tyrosine-phosphatase n=1 Tax=Paenibacillus endoradicis TaxID=2972487 RepID=UPI002158AEA1|nr:low molecular weight protein-tyrosine-phosphatase [Paenibacillus endoradicis]MCR8656828.1 low molecular weight phosphotyrosine protein phosphatase [Paenibacillus endoradicis]
MTRKTKVLFVCLGNICRSPMAEAVMRHFVMEEKLADVIEVDSAGTGDWHIGKQPHEGTRTLLDNKQISYTGMKARQITGSDEVDFQYIVCMDDQNLKDVQAVFNAAKADGAKGKVITFMSLVDGAEVTEVPDPYYTGNFEYVYELIDEGCRKLLEDIKSEWK